MAAVRTAVGRVSRVAVVSDEPCGANRCVELRGRGTGFDPHARIEPDATIGVWVVVQFQVDTEKRLRHRTR